MKIGSAVGFAFRGPHAWANLGLTLVCSLIPVIGPMVVAGYMVGVQRVLVENIEADAPRFDFGKFSLYLTRGLWPFLVGLVATLILMPLVWGIMFVGIVGGVVAGHHLWLGLVVVAAAACAYVVLMVVWGVAMVPMTLKAGLEERFAAGFDVRFLVDYLKRVGLLTLGTGMLMVLMIAPVALASLCVFFVGPLALMAVLQFVRTHVDIQLYREYLARGGMALAMKAEAVESAFPVVMPAPR